jgi:hypothetical protein
MVLYGPLQKQRPSEEYLDATTGSVALGNVGLEWIVPSTMILTTVVVVLRLLRVSLFDQTVSIGTTLAWTFLIFSYLHDQMHVKNTIQFSRLGSGAHESGMTSITGC